MLVTMFEIFNSSLNAINRNTGAFIVSNRFRDDVHGVLVEMMYNKGKKEVLLEIASIFQCDGDELCISVDCLLFNIACLVKTSLRNTCTQ